VAPPDGGELTVRRSHRRCGGREVVLAATAALVLTGCGQASDSGGSGAAPPATWSTGPTAAPSTEPPAEPDPPPAEAADPVRVRIPAIGVDTSLVPLSIDANGTLAAPERFDVAGWNRDGPEPGEPGAAVIAGHVDSRSGPAVFYRLRELTGGDRVLVDRADGSTVTFEVTGLAQYDKREVPSDSYASATGVELRLVTCGGEFDRSAGSYRDNVIVSARQPDGG
jgi:sortase (surface protein transpeptidase)